MAKRKAARGQMERVAEGIYRRNGSYLVPIYDAKSKKKAWHGPNCAAACGHDRIVDLASARAAKRTLENSKSRRAGRSDETVGEWAARWLEVFPRKEESTNVHNRERIRSFVEGDSVARGGERKGGFAARALRSLTDDDVWPWAQAHLSSVKEVRAMLNDAIKLRLLEENPLQHFTLAERRGREDISVLTLPELDLLLDVAHEVHGGYGDHFSAMIELAAWTGVRPGELFLFSRRPGAHLNHLDVAEGVVRVEWQWNSKVRKPTVPKWESRRKVVLLPRALDALRRVEDFGPGPLFKTKRGTDYTARNHHYYWDPVRRLFTERLPEDHWLRIRIREAAARGEDENLDFYELRHFFGTALAHPPVGITPASPYQIAKMMGHKDGGKLAMKVYIHGEDSEVADSLRAAWADHAPRRRTAVGE